MINISVLLQGTLSTFIVGVASTLVWVGITDAQSLPTQADNGQPGASQKIAQNPNESNPGQTEGSSPLQTSNPLQDSGPLQGVGALQGAGPLQGAIPVQDVLPLPPSGDSLTSSLPQGGTGLLPEVPNIPLLPTELTSTQIVALGSGNTSVMNQLIGQLLGGNTDPTIVQSIINAVTAGSSSAPAPILVATAPGGGSTPTPTTAATTTTTGPGVTPPTVLPPTNYVSNQ